ncbi:MAG: NUDIX hydrolase [Anaerolineae bacterium]
MPPKPWSTRSSRLVYQNPWTRVREDIAEMPDGRTTLYGVVECSDAVGVLPFVDDNHVVMVRQYRYVFNENGRWEMPTGGVKPGESLADAARRELREEVGYDAQTLTPISTFYSSKSIVQETCHVFIGRDLVRAEALPDETEFLEVAVLPFADVLAMTLASEIRDAMTVIAVLTAARGRAP